MHVRTADPKTHSQRTVPQFKNRRVTEREPAFSTLFLKYVLSHSLRVEEDLVEQLFNSSETRLARALLLLAHFGKKTNRTEPFPMSITPLLAEMIGTTRPRVNFFMNKFRKLGLIDYDGTLTVHNGLLNVVLHD